jgi:hypothetical protein
MAKSELQEDTTDEVASEQGDPQFVVDRPD